MSDYEIVREACIKANRTELRVEGPCLRFGGNHVCVHCNAYIGRPIRLADVLLALNAATSRTPLFSINDDGTLSDDMTSKDFWNLRGDDLTRQTPETLKFLAELLRE